VSVEQTVKKDFILTIAGLKYKAKNLDSNFLEFVEEHLNEVGIGNNKDNSVKSLFFAYLTLAKKHYICEQEIEEIVKNIEL
jgi:hypothetical protein